MKSLKFPAYAAALLLLTLIACRKDKDEAAAPGTDYPALAEHARAMGYMNDLMQQVDNAATGAGLRSTDDACAPAVTTDTIAMPHTLTIDFGDSDCTAANGRMRRGVLFVTFTGPYHAPGTVITITPQDYFVDDHHIEGTRTVTNMGSNADGLPYFTVVADITVTAPDGSWTATHHAQRTRTWVQGSDTPDPMDDAYAVTGQGHGVNRNGPPCTMEITSPLHVHHGCPFITQGTVTFTPEGHPVRTIDYGNGACDNTATVTVNGQSWTITIG